MTRIVTSRLRVESCLTAFHYLHTYQSYLHFKLDFVLFLHSEGAYYTSEIIFNHHFEEPIYPYISLRVPATPVQIDSASRSWVT